MKKSDENIAGFFRWTTQPNLLSINYIYSFGVVYIRKVKKSESKSQHQGTCSTKIIFERNRGRLSTQLIRLS